MGVSNWNQKMKMLDKNYHQNIIYNIEIFDYLFHNKVLIKFIC